MILVSALRNYLQVILIVLLALFLFRFVHFQRGQVRNISQLRLFQLFFLLHVSVTSSGFKKLEQPLYMNSVQFSRSVVSDSLRPHESQDASYATVYVSVSMYFDAKINILIDYSYI